MKNSCNCSRKNVSNGDFPKCMLLNARSIVNKYNKLLSLIKIHEPALIAITESWLQREIKINIPEYLIFRCDRSSKGGGVLLGIKEVLKPTFIKEQRFGTSELIIVSILNNFGIFLVYRPPNAPQSELMSLVSFLENETEAFQRYTIIGDLNLPLINWNKYSTNDPRSRIFLDFCNDNSLFQFVKFPTRSRNILDLILSPNNNIFSVKSHPPLGASDHQIIEFYIDEGYDDNFEPYYVFDYYRADYELINAFLMTINWNEFFLGCHDTYDHWYRFHELIVFIHNEFIPLKLVQKRRNFNDKKRKSLYRIKCKKWRKFQLTSLERDRINYLYAKDEYETYTSRKKVNYEKSLFYNRKKNPKSFYNYINRHVKGSERLIPTLCSKTVGSGQVLSIHDNEKAEIFSQQYKKAFVRDNNILPHVEPYNINFPSEFNAVTPNEAIIAMKSVNSNSSPGPDGIPPIFYRKCAANFATPVSCILNKSFFEGIVLEEWKLANVIPIFKNGDKSNPINYRGITITPIFPKLAEFIIRDRIITHLRQNNLMTRSQHGFIGSRSVSTNLLECLDDWTKNIDNGLDTDILYFDFSKAFDSVVHSKLIHKLRHQYQLNEFIVNWVQNFLNKRKQQVKVGRSLSEPAEVVSGVAQGTLLGPILFIMYTNDMTEVIQHSSVSLYADDTKLYKTIRDNLDNDLLQIDAENITTWSITWQLPLNPLKMVLLQVPSNNDRSYVVLGSEVVPKHSNKDLGIIIQDNLSFKEHCTNVARNATFIIRNTKMCFTNHTAFYYIFVFKTYIRPTLETNTVVFSPHTIECVDILERVQRRFTKYLPGLWDMSYADRMKFLGIKSLEERRIFFDIMFLYKVITGHTNLNPDSFFKFNTNQTRGHSLKIEGTNAKKDVRKYFWPNRVIAIWNNLPSDIIDQRSDFRLKLEKVDLSPYCIGSAFHRP